ncbi:hypothetical protein V8E36_008706 [Tilletia maclaganii]
MPRKKSNSSTAASAKKSSAGDGSGLGTATPATSAPATTTVNPQSTSTTTPTSTRKRKRGKHSSSSAPTTVTTATTAVSANEDRKAQGTTASQTTKQPQAATGTKRKRNRKRNRRTTAALSTAQDKSDSDSSSSSYSDDDDAPPRCSAIAPPAKLGTRSQADDSESSSSESSSESDSDADTRQGSAAQRKQAAIPTGTSLGPDPESLTSQLDEQTRRALSYAQRFARDKAAWKFEKQRQNWLLRHALDLDLDYVLDSDSKALDGGDASGEPEQNWDATMTGAEGDKDDDTAVRIPAIYADVLAWYYANMQGGAKTRIVETLRTAADLDVPDEPAKSHPTESTEAASAVGPTPSFSIGDLAMAKEKAEEAAEKIPDGATADRSLAATAELNRRRKVAAQRLLELMGER